MNRSCLGRRALPAFAAILGLLASFRGDLRAAELLVGGATVSITTDQPVAPQACLAMMGGSVRQPPKALA